MAKERSAIARGVAALPLLLMGLVHLTVTPLRQMFDVEPTLMYGWYAIGILVGVYLFRKTRTVRDYEFHRSQTMKSMKRVYQAEEEGVWKTTVQLDSSMSPEGVMKLQQQVGSIDQESPELELHEDEKVEVDLLLETEQVRRANRRLSGTEMFDDERVHSTIGAKRKASPMDAFLDFVGSLFGRVDANELREERRLAALRAASVAAPVTAQRPVAPMRSQTTREDSQLKITSVSDDGGIDSVMSESGETLLESVPIGSGVDNTYAWDTTVPSSNRDSIESMAMLGMPETRFDAKSKAIVPSAGNVCKGCKATIPIGEPFCLHCGLDA